MEPERKRREYKRDLPGAGREARKEFVSDVSAFANTEGGTIYFGIEEDRATSTPCAVDGVLLAEAEREIAVLENVLRDSVRPRVPSLQLHVVRLSADRGVLAIRVGASHLRPHQSTLDYRFYARNTNGKYRLDVAELADIIIRREDLPARMQRFRRERIDLIRYAPEDVPSPISAAAKFVIHYMPEQSFGRFDVIDLATVIDAGRRGLMQRAPVRNTRGLSYRANLDGFVLMNGMGQDRLQWYAQIFYDGTIEINSGITFISRFQENAFHPAWVEGDLFESFLFARDVYARLDLGGRVSVAASALGIRDYVISFGADSLPSALAFTGHNTTIGRDPVLFNPVVVDSMREDPAIALRPIIEQVSRAGGLSSARCYDAEGNYVGYRG